MTRKTFFLISIMALAALSFSALPVRAQDDDRRISLGPRYAYFDPKDGDGASTVGAQLRFLLSDYLGLEGSIDFRREEFGATDVDIFPFQVSLLGFLNRPSSVRFFVLGGPGWYYTRVSPPDPADDTTDHRFGFHAGGGLQFFLNEAWSIDGSYRYTWIEDLESKEETTLVDKDFSDRGSQVTGSLNFHF